MRFLKEREEPSVNVSVTDIFCLKNALHRALKVEPIAAKPRQDKVEPRLKKSKIDAFDPPVSLAITDI
jgi:hypothetical protein